MLSYDIICTKCIWAYLCKDRFSWGIPLVPPNPLQLGPWQSNEESEQVATSEILQTKKEEKLKLRGSSQIRGKGGGPLHFARALALGHKGFTEGHGTKGVPYFAMLGIKAWVRQQI